MRVGAGADRATLPRGSCSWTYGVKCWTALSLTRNSLLKHTDEAWDVQVALMEHLERRMGPAGQRAVGDARAAAPFHPLQGDGLGGGGPDGQRGPGFGLPGPADRWEALRDTIHAEVMANGFDADRNTFVQSYGRPELDASLLLHSPGGLPPAATIRG